MTGWQDDFYPASHLVTLSSCQIEKELIMHVGILTAPLRTQPLAELIPWAAQQGIRALEIDVRSGSSLDALKADDAALEQLQGLLSAHNVQISSLACYTLLTGVTTEQAAQNRKE